ncbi:hypothetical protein JST97_27475 [bacterium]|nr:hypothetical protein [bacterium]
MGTPKIPSDFRPLDAAGGVNQYMSDWRPGPADDAGRLWFVQALSRHAGPDAGQHWQVVELENSVSCVFFGSDRQAWIACDGGKLLLTRDGGATREALAAVGLDGGTIEQLHFFDDFQGLALVRAKHGSQLMTSEDGGKSWKQKLVLGEGSWSRLEVLDRQHAWAGGSVGGAAYVVPFSTDLVAHPSATPTGTSPDHP